jgi:organic hydroperoxide reductase OsmC/OhrA
MSTNGNAPPIGRNKDNPLLRCGLPIFFPLEDVDELGLALPENRHGQSVRVWARSLTLMQKEAVVVSVRSGTAWRLASDEGPYLDGLDAAPCPLAFMTTGMVSSYMQEILSLAARRDVTLRDLVLVQDNFYTMEGSALRGTMTGGALPVALEVRVDTTADDDALRDLVTEAVRASPVDGLMRPRHTSLFTLTMNGHEIPIGRVASLGRPAEPDPSHHFSRLSPAAGSAGLAMTRLDAVRPVAGVAGGAGTSLQAEQRRRLHVRAYCRRRPDGVKEIEQHLYSPLGSTFRLLSDEAPELGGAGAAPDAVSYMAAGLAFCFMTQLGRYATILKKDVERYQVVQDTHFSLGGASGGTGHPGTADPVETHVCLDTTEGEEFARHCLDMAEQTCFLHSLCRTPLEPSVTITRA